MSNSPGDRDSDELGRPLADRARNDVRLFPETFDGLLSGPIMPRRQNLNRNPHLYPGHPQYRDPNTGRTPPAAGSVDAVMETRDDGVRLRTRPGGVDRVRAAITEVFAEAARSGLLDQGPAAGREVIDVETVDSPTDRPAIDQ